MLTISAMDGYSLAATLYEPTTPAQKQFVLVASAMGVKQKYYHHFASFLAEQGFHVLTFDYRGVGDSAPASLRKFPANLSMWALQDLEGVVQWIGEHYPNYPLMVVTHSVGGQILSAIPSYNKIAAVLMVASQSGYWGLWSGAMRLKILFLWYVGIPVSTAVTGIFPANWFGLGDKLPAGVGREWGRWGRSPGYIRDHITTYFEAMPIPIRAYSFEDDPFAPAPSVAKLVSYYANANAEHIHVSPSDVEGKAIGHFGFFRRQFREFLWQPAVDWLKVATPQQIPEH